MNHRIGYSGRILFIFSQKDSQHLKMEQLPQPLRTKAFYKHQFQLLESLKVCSEVNIIRNSARCWTSAHNPAKRSLATSCIQIESASQKKVQCGLSLEPTNIVKTIIISSADKMLCTPPRSPRPAHDYENTLRASVSPMSGKSDLTIPSDICQPTKSERHLPLPQHDQSSELKTKLDQPQLNYQREQLWSSDTMTISSKVLMPPSTPTSVEAIPFESRHIFSDEMKRELQTCLREAMRRCVPHKPYKRIFTVGGKKLRVHVNRQGNIFVTVR
ncbi:uncharacterized protein isoform X2 [Musca autumnalis]|uniref:uncharacterized protein isoform X2 n=1 Tax=Musca autumnalis TaxID=221902 RepID=UPI003CF66803